MKTVNARGKPCPEPVTLTKRLVDQGERELEVLLDNPVSASNVTRFLKSQGYDVLLKDDEGALSIAASKKDAPRTEPKAPPPSGEPEPSVTDEAREKKTFSILLTCQYLGRSDVALGEVLMKGFLGTLPQMGESPRTIALMNEGVKLAVYDSSSCDHLKNLEKKGVVILVCGTCVNHFALNEQIGVGVISNMFEILETLNQADKVITL